MSRRLLHTLIRLYPPAFRRRYGRELHDLVDELSRREPRRAARSALGLVAGAAGEWWRRSRPQAVAALLIPALALAVGVGLTAQPGGATPALRVTLPGKKARRVVVPHVQVVPRGPQACFVGGCGLHACPVLVAPVGPGHHLGRTTAQTAPCSTPNQAPATPHAVFISAA